MNWNLLHRYLTEECTPRQRQHVESWLAADPRNQEFMDSLERIWEVEPEDQVQVDARAAWQEFNQRMGPADPVPSPHSNSGSDYGRLLAYGLAAAAVAVVAFLFFQQVPSVTTNAAEPAPAMQQIVTEKGQRTTVRLADGTRVQLNADSRLQIPADYMQGAREVRLRGEAYFEVEVNPDKPFLVQSGGAYTRVLGTKFGVRAYPGDPCVQVVVAKGAVELGYASKDGPVTAGKITKNEIGILTPGQSPQVASVPSLDRYLGWTDGRLVFDDTPLRQVQAQLERWYDIQVQMADSALGRRRLTATFSGEPMTEVLSIVALSTDMRYAREARTVIFRDRRK